MQWYVIYQLQGSYIGSISSDQLEKGLSFCMYIFEIQPVAYNSIPWRQFAGESFQTMTEPCFGESVTLHFAERR